MDKAENITSCVAFIAWIAAATKQIRLGTGTINMPNAHPAAIADCHARSHAGRTVHLWGQPPVDIETYLSSNSVKINRHLELDAMLGSLDFVAQSDWLCILPGIMMAGESDKKRSFTVNPIVEPRFGLDLIEIEPSRQVLSTAASAFLEILEQEASRLNKRWPPA